MEETGWDDLNLSNKKYKCLFSVAKSFTTMFPNKYDLGLGWAWWVSVTQSITVVEIINKYVVYCSGITNKNL